MTDGTLTGSRRGKRQASLETFWIGSIAAHFWSHFNRWAAEYAQQLEVVTQYRERGQLDPIEDEALRHAQDDAAEMVLRSANSQQRAIANMLKEGGYTAGEIGERVRLSTSQVHYEIRKFRVAGWALVRRGLIAPELVPGTDRQLQQLLESGVSAEAIAQRLNITVDQLRRNIRVLERGRGWDDPKLLAEWNAENFKDAGSTLGDAECF